MDRFKVGDISGLSNHYRDLGAKEGSAHRPPPEAPAPDGHEVGLVAKAQEFVVAEQHAFNSALTDAKRKVREAEVEITEAGNLCRSAQGTDLLQSAFRSAIAKHRPTLVNLAVGAKRARASLSYYRHRNDVHDPARYPRDLLLHFAWLIFFVALETGVNAFFYEGAAGLLGGAVVALGVAAVNMGVAAVLGIAFRYSNLPGLKNGLIGWGSLLVFIALALTMNLIFSTFRVQYGLIDDSGNWIAVREAFIVAVKEAFGVFTLRFPAVDFNSFILFFIGLGCSLIAFYKGYTVDDKFPGHGDLHREADAAQQKFADLKQIARIEALAELQRKISDLELLRTRVVALSRNVIALKAQAEHAQSAYWTSVQGIQNELSVVIEAYRGGNRATRAIRTPTYFEQSPSVMPPSDGKPELGELLATVQGTFAEAQRLADNHMGPLGDMIVKAHQVSDHLLADDFERLMDEIDQRADDEVTASVPASQLGLAS